MKRITAYCVLNGVKLYVVSPNSVSPFKICAYYSESYDQIISWCKNLISEGLKTNFYVCEN